jgi:hypothetical protein
MVALVETVKHHQSQVPLSHAPEVEVGALTRQRVLVALVVEEMVPLERVRVRQEQ